MIKNAAELLESFVLAERAKVEVIDMPHMPTLGNAYEAIANAGIEREFVLPPKLDLRVVSGFIDGIPNQIDGMLVRGEGQQYGLTDQFIYPIEQVLCVLEVKKTLRKGDLADGIAHLASVQKLFVKNFIARLEAGEVFDFEAARSSYEKLTGRSGPRSATELDGLPPSDRLLFITLARQLYAPVTVLLGFDGYSTERGLREAILDVVESHVGGNSVAAPELLPSLITAGQFSVVKCTGRPYLVARATGDWVLLASATLNVARILLEFLWTKISRCCEVRMPFGPDLDHENLKELLIARGASMGGAAGFELWAKSYSTRQLERPAVKRWEPSKLSPAAIAVAEFAGSRGELELDDSLAEYIAQEHSERVDAVVAELLRTGAFRRQGDILQLVSHHALIASFPDGAGYLDVHSERLRLWCDEQRLKPYYMTIVNIG
ncbi:DUF6602 domain-containing protein [Achromobacter sp. NPDC058515]|uniref:DUF6602 domain-containing protein n=1 Tax=Achromobacter sp. NPDC058515 TaxID=3346533 RepID=UPI00365D22BC